MSIKGKEITSFNFDFQKSEDTNFQPHLAVTLTDLDGAASGYNTALLLKSLDEQSSKEVLETFMKAKQELNKVVELEAKLEKATVSVEMDFEDYLCKFFSMYYSEASLLAEILGMRTQSDDFEIETYDSYLAEQASAVTIMKSLKDSNESDKGFNSLDINEKLSVLSLQKSFETYLSNKESSVASEETTKEEVQTDVTIEKSQEKGEEIMDFKELLKSKEMQDLLANVKAEAIEDLQKSAKAEKAELEGKIADLVKAKEDAEAEAEKIALEAETDKVSELVKSLSFVAEDKQEDLIKSLVANRNAEGIESVVEALDAAKEAVEAVALEKSTVAPEGSDQESEISKETESSIMKALKAKNAKKETK